MQILASYPEFESFAYIARRYNSAAEATSLLIALGCLVGNNYVVINEIREQKIGNDVTDRARVQFSFSHFSCSFSIIIIIIIIIITLSFIYPSFKNIYTLCSHFRATWVASLLKNQLNRGFARFTWQALSSHGWTCLVTNQAVVVTQGPRRRFSSRGEGVNANA